MMTQTNQLPLFPLQLVLFPQGILPLKIFEQRYVDMIRSCLRNKTGFVVVSACKGTPLRDLPFSKVGTLAEIIDTDVPQPGLFNIKCHGLQKIEIQSAWQQEDGLWIGEIERLSIEPDIGIPEDLSSTKVYFEQLVESLKSQNFSSEALPFSTPFQLENCAWLANRWCELLDISLIEKQRMLELDNPLIRLELINDMLNKYTKNTND